MGEDGQIRRDRVIIDTDPGIDDSMTILMAFGEPSVEIIGLTTIFGNVTTEYATRNALLLCERAGHPEVPVAEGSPEPLKGGEPRVADFVHGSDGLGNLSLPAPTTKKVEESAAEFMVNKVSQFPGEISVLALGPLTNVALIYGDPDAADVVFTSGADIDVVGINITTQCCFTDEDLLELKNSKGVHAQFLCDMCKFYRDWHEKSDGFQGIFLHDPVSFTALVHPEYFTFKKGVVRVETQGICTGHTLMDHGLKKWNSENPWSGYAPISVAWTVDVPKVLAYVKKLLMAP
ncbi:hypothetical protein TRIUR3_15036 [Triticum urartu]|uniref:Inosine/uridine-preferring nucleoside hydrolase domain-containing protein n=2 Tax=Triticum TaxID=4564 RepID=A0A9R0ZDD2_TRITD|nr:hypothetical protein TRIUR3_15036 [Triticum urartu]VAI74959.1 unnamed protein product [Triticum turgidum subsp. durum]